MGDVAIVVQGRLHRHSLETLHVYKRYGKVYLSCQTGDDLGLLKEYDMDGVEVIVNDGHTRRASTYNQQNVFYQVLTTAEAAQRAALDGAKWTIKLRSDHSVGTLDPFLTELERSPLAYVCSNLHFRPDATFKFHPSDKFIAMDSSLMAGTFELAMKRVNRDAILLKSGIYDYTFMDGECPYEWYRPGMPSQTTHDQAPIVGAPCVLPWGYVGTYPEVVLGTSFLLAQGIRPDRSRSREQMKEHFRIVRMTSCLPFRDKDGNPAPMHNWNEAHHISEV